MKKRDIVMHRVDCEINLWKRFKNTIPRGTYSNINQVFIEMIRDRVEKFEGGEKSGMER